MSNQHFYAERSPYGIRTTSPADTLHQFSCKADRDAVVNAFPDTFSPVTLKEVKHRYDLRKFSCDGQHGMWVTEVFDKKAKSTRLVHSERIGYKPSYRTQQW